jgi:predicted component of type VI protein secretion system
VNTKFILLLVVFLNSCSSTKFSSPKIETNGQSQGDEAKKTSTNQENEAEINPQQENPTDVRVIKSARSSKKIEICFDRLGASSFAGLGILKYLTKNNFDIQAFTVVREYPYLEALYYERKKINYVEWKLHQWIFNFFPLTETHFDEIMETLKSELGTNLILKNECRFSPNSDDVAQPMKLYVTTSKSISRPEYLGDEPKKSYKITLQDYDLNKAAALSVCDFSLVDHIEFGEKIGQHFTKHIIKMGN